MIKQVIILLVFFLSSFSSFASNDDKLVLTGKVNDITTQESLAGVKVYVEGTTISTYTDLNGNYVLFVPKTLSGKLIFSTLSYSENKLDIKTASSTKEITLTPSE